jgi:hypothetical protein
LAELRAETKRLIEREDNSLAEFKEKLNSNNTRAKNGAVSLIAASKNGSETNQITNQSDNMNLYFD